MKITVITVAYNSAKTIGDTLDSVASQDYENVEHIVVDGASSDSTPDLVRNHGNSRIRLVSEPDEGIYDAMNKGMALAEGDIIGFLNSDDVYAESTTLSSIARVFEDSSIEGSYGDLVYVSRDDSRVIRYWKSKSFVPGAFSAGWCPPHPTFYVRSSVIQRMGMYDLTYKMGLDVELMMRYLEVGQIRTKYVPQVMVRMRTGGVSNQSWSNIVLQNREVLSALRNNDLPHSVVWFIASKFVVRLRQYASGFFRRNK